MNVYDSPQGRESPSLTTSLQSFSKISSIGSVLIGIAVMLGWIFDVPLLKSVLPGLVAMKVNTATGLILGGSSVWLWHRQPSNQLTRRTACACAFIVLLIGLLTLIEYGFNLDLHIDQILFKTPIDPLNDAAPGRMAVHTALNFLLLGSALVLLNVRRPNWLASQVLALVVFLIAFLGLLGYLYGNAYFYRFGSITSIALHTAVAFILLSLSILFARPSGGVMAVVVSPHVGGLVAQRLLPAAIVLPPLVCGLALSGYRGQVYTAELGISLLSILNVIIFAVLIWCNAHFLNRVDHRRRQAETSLKQALEELEQKVEERTIELRLANEQLENEIALAIAANSERAIAEEALRTSNERLEVHVAERTAQLQEINNELEAFTYSVSHDLRAPLRTMQGFTQALLEDYGDQLDSLGQDYARYISDAALQMDTLISDLLSYSRLSRTEIHLQPTDLTLVVQDALNQLGTLLEGCSVTFIAPLSQVIAHRTTLVQVVTNLLTNAIKFVEPGVQPKVRVWAEERHDWIRLWVADNGIGIESKYLERIFRVFERLHGVEVYPGTGIGLAIVAKGVERMGGRFGVESQPGQGSQFWVDLPLAEGR